MSQTKINNVDIRKPLVGEDITLGSGINIFNSNSGTNSLGTPSLPFESLYANNVFVSGGSIGNGVFVYVTGDSMSGSLTLGTGNSLLSGGSGVSNIGSPSNPFLNGYIKNIFIENITSPLQFLPVTGGSINGEVTFTSSANLVLQPGSDIVPSTSGNNDIGTAANPFNTIYANNLFATGTTGAFVLKAGDTMSGDLIMDFGSKIITPEVRILDFGSQVLISAIPASGGYINIPSGGSILINSTGSHATGVRIIGAVTIGSGAFASGDSSLGVGMGVLTTGNFSLAVGFESKAFGEYSAAFGQGSIASGLGSHAEGNQSIAFGNYSHAEGSAFAYGDASHAEGGSNSVVPKAFGSYSHAEGQSTVASGSESHAEGLGTKAFGSSSHSEGQGTQAYGDYSHAEGTDTVASGNYSHAAGSSTITIGDASFAGGDSSQAYGFASAAFGDGSQSWEPFSFAEGSSIASGTYAHAEGQSQAFGTMSHSEGEDTIAQGQAAHAEGGNSEAQGSYSHVEGYLTVAVGDYAHVEGLEGSGIGIASHVEGNNCVAYADYSHAEGRFSEARGYTSHAQGYGCLTSGDFAFAAGQDAFALHNNSMAFADSLGVSTTAVNQFMLGFSNGIVLRSGTNVLNATSGTNDLGSAANPFRAIYAGSIISTGSEGNFVNISGDTMTGNLTMSSAAIVTNTISGNGQILNIVDASGISFTAAGGNIDIRNETIDLDGTSGELVRLSGSEVIISQGGSNNIAAQNTQTVISKNLWFTSGTNIVGEDNFTITNASGNQSILINPSSGITINGSAGDLSLVGGAGDILITGGADDIIVSAGGGDLQLLGGGGQVLIDGGGAPVNINGGTGGVNVNGDGSQVGISGNGINVLSTSSADIVVDGGSGSANTWIKGAAAGGVIISGSYSGPGNLSLRAGLGAGNIIETSGNIVPVISGNDNIGSSALPYQTIHAQELSGVNARGYVYSYDTSNQTVAVANTFQDVVFSTSPLLDGWSHVSGTMFTGNIAGVYEVAYTATINRVGTPACTIELRSVKNGTEIAGSQSVTTLVANAVPQEMSNTFLTSISSGDVLKVQLTANTTDGQIASFGANATTRPSIRLAIHKL